MIDITKLKTALDWHENSCHSLSRLQQEFTPDLPRMEDQG